MSYRTYIPCDVLKPYVKLFAIAESAEETTYKILPGTGLVLGFQYKGRVANLDNGKKLLGTAGITGLHDNYKVFSNTADTGTLLVYFNDTGASAFFRSPLHELYNDSVSLDCFILKSELILLEEQLCEAKADMEKLAVVERFLIGRMHTGTTDDIVTGALTLIYKHKGNIRIKNLAALLYTSQSPLEKKFRAVVGTSPKKFASIVRMKNLVDTHTTNRALTAAGYDAVFMINRIS